MKRETKPCSFEKLRQRPEKLRAVCAVAVPPRSRAATANLLYYVLRDWNLRATYKRPEGEWLVRSHDDLVSKQVATSTRTSKRALALLIDAKLLHKREVVVKGRKCQHLAPTPALCDLLAQLEATALALDPKLFDALIQAACDGWLRADNPDGLAFVFERLRAGASAAAIKDDLQRVMAAAAVRIGKDGIDFAKTKPGADGPDPNAKMTHAAMLAMEEADP